MGGALKNSKAASSLEYLSPRRAQAPCAPFLGSDPELSQRQLAQELGVSLGGVNYALKALIERGVVKVDNFGKSGTKFAYLCVLSPKGVEALDRGHEGRG